MERERAGATASPKEWKKKEDCPGLLGSGDFSVQRVFQKLKDAFHPQVGIYACLFHLLQLETALQASGQCYRIDKA